MNTLSGVFLSAIVKGKTAAITGALLLAPDGDLHRVVPEVWRIAGLINARFGQLPGSSPMVLEEITWS